MNIQFQSNGNHFRSIATLDAGITDMDAEYNRLVDISARGEAAKFNLE